MKRYLSKKEGEFIELVNIELTKEQKNLIKDTSEENKEARKNLFRHIKEQREQREQNEEIINNLIDFYNSKKPELKENDEYVLLTISITEIEENIYRGILNCRVNGKHKQIRF